MKKKEEESLLKKTHKKVNTVGDLKKWLDLFDDSEPLLMASDEEGNEINKILYMELFAEGLIFFPYHRPLTNNMDKQDKS